MTCKNENKTTRIKNWTDGHFYTQRKWRCIVLALIDHASTCRLYKFKQNVFSSYCKFTQAEHITIAYYKPQLPLQIANCKNFLTNATCSNTNVFHKLWNNGIGMLWGIKLQKYYGKGQSFLQNGKPNFVSEGTRPLYLGKVLGASDAL